MIPRNARTWQRVWLYLLWAGGIWVVGFCAWPYTVDDAYILARYALRISRGEGYTWNPGQASDGVTGPLWLLPGLLGAWLGSDPVVAAKLCGLACSAWCAITCIREQTARARGEIAAAFSVALLVCQPSMGGSGSSGLETGAATLLTCWACRAALGAPAPRRSLLGACAAGLAWLRPELAPVVLVLLGVATVRLGRRSWPAWTLAGIGCAGVCGLRLWLHGGRGILPLAWYAKAGGLSDGLGYSIRAIPVMTGLLGLGLACAGARWGGRRDRIRAALLVVHTLSVTLAGGDWMPGFRLFVPLFPQYALLAGVGAERLLRRGTSGKLLASACALLACGIPLLDLGLRLPEWRAAGESRERVGRAIVEDLRRFEVRKAALVDIGFIGYASGIEIIDLGGLTDVGVAVMPGGHLDKQIPLSWLRDRAPDALILHSTTPPSAAADGRLLGLRGNPVEMRIARSAWVAREFRVQRAYRYAPGYHYVLLRHIAP
jgi:hypothetical protein